ncbi:MAG: ferrochelatase [Alphaproteobacteria bacterium]|nr:ferrochelatase [Alphaproteobacteria bacterium]
MHPPRTGLLLLNLGTPDSPSTADVRRYLAEFLDDPRVVDIHPLARKLLLNLVILPFRPARSAAAYRTIWTERGSPLLFHTRDLAEGVAAELGQGWQVEVAMRYGNPDLPSALRRLQDAGVDRVVAIPLYPQYASSSTGSSLEQLYREAGRLPAVPALVTVKDFYDRSAFLDPAADAAREAVTGADHVLFSFHGVPERQVRATEIGGSGRCLASRSCCDRIGPVNRCCYRAQSFATARALAERLALPPERWSVGFQSRLGRTPWIQPFTDALIPALAEQGVKTLAVLCPSFVADCLETLEEIGDRARADFLAAGGEALRLAPCVNSRPDWARGVADMARAAIGA